MITKVKKVLALLFLGLGFTTAQVNESILAEFDLMSEMVNKDIRKAIYQGLIPADIAITSFGVYGFTEDEKKYFQEVMNRIFYNDISFKLVSIQEDQAVQVGEVDNELVIKKVANKNIDLKRYAESINSKHYGEIYIYAMANSIYMKILVHDADVGDVVWSKSWSVRRDNRFTVEIGPRFAYAYHMQNAYYYIHSFMGARAVGLGEFGLSIDLGAYHGLSLIYFNLFNLSPVDEKEDTGLDDIGVSLFFSPKVSLNIMELIKYNYIGFDIYGIIQPGMRVDLLITIDESKSSDSLYRPRFYFSGLLGLGLGFKRIHMDFLIDANYNNGLFYTLSIYYKF